MWEDVNSSGVADRLQKIVPCKHVAGGSWERRKGDGTGTCELGSDGWDTPAPSSVWETLCASLLLVYETLEGVG